MYAVVDIVSALALPNGASNQSLSLQRPHLNKILGGVFEMTTLIRRTVLEREQSC